MRCLLFRQVGLSILCLLLGWPLFGYSAEALVSGPPNLVMVYTSDVQGQIKCLG